MIIQSGMNIKIRTKEEAEVFIDIAYKEGHRWRNGLRVKDVDIIPPRSISVGYITSDVYPNDLSQDRIGYCGGNARNIVEASQLFRNQLISKQVKGKKVKKNQLNDKFVICRTKDEFDFIVYHAKKLLDMDIAVTFDHPICIRLKTMYVGDAYRDDWGWNEIGDYEADPEYGNIKEEECSMLFGNLIKRWKHEHRTENSDSLP
jgi:hypothetical protein